jgi:hypothetical protein
MGFQLREIQVKAQSANNPSDLRVLEFREEKSCPPTQVTILGEKSIAFTADLYQTYVEVLMLILLKLFKKLK